MASLISAPVAQSACLYRHVTAFPRYLRDKSNSMAGRYQLWSSRTDGQAVAEQGGSN
jgi:hypothetical protein